MPTHREIHTLHRYFIWADRLKAQFDAHLLAHGAPSADEVNLYPWMPYWYGALFVVAEGWQELQLHDDQIDRLLGEPTLALLRRYRNGAFHFQSEYHDQRLTALIAEGAASAQWVRELHEAFSRWFLDYFADWRERQES